jgi:hypothetical protein
VGPGDRRWRVLRDQSGMVNGATSCPRVHNSCLGRGMTVPLPILSSGKCEPFKAWIHGASLGLLALMGLYYSAAWINRRERHLAINAIVYGLGVAYERRLVAHHLAACRRQVEQIEPCSCEELKAA